ncbi:MAG: hypothetical protein LBF40_00555 [Deltaproteobacteria bacterium]|jgi:hypothetical protein|nr:hypothetical protein [Deltaproteobacteria bacterium]
MRKQRILPFFLIFLPVLFLLSCVDGAGDYLGHSLFPGAYENKKPVQGKSISKLDVQNLGPGQVYTKLSAVQGTLSSAGDNSYYAQADQNVSYDSLFSGAGHNWVADIYRGKYLFSPQVSTPIFMSMNFTLMDNSCEDLQFVYFDFLDGSFGLQSTNNEDLDRRFEYQGAYGDYPKNYPDAMPIEPSLSGQTARKIPFTGITSTPLRPNHNSAAIYQDNQYTYVYINGIFFKQFEHRNPSPGYVGISLDKYEKVSKNRVRFDNVYLATDRMAYGFANALKNAVDNRNSNIANFKDMFDIKIGGSLNSGKSRIDDNKYQLREIQFNFQTIETSVQIRPVSGAALTYPLYINVTYTLQYSLINKKDDRIREYVIPYEKQYYLESADSVISDKFPLEFIESVASSNVFGKFSRTLTATPKITAYVTGTYSIN